ncbi:hypothetical protein RJI07_03705 [Mycoplasmatota bacterium WC30]
MLNTLKSKKGIGLPMILGITSFLFISVLVLTTMVLYQAKAQEADFQYQQEYTLAQTKINATLDSIIENEDTSAGFLNDISTFMDVDITQYNPSIILISKVLTSGSIVKSYLSSSTESISLVDEYLIYDGFESGFELNPIFTPTILLTNHLKEFFSVNFPSIEVADSYQDIDDIFAFIQGLTSTSENYIEVDKSVLTGSSNPTVNGHWYINDDVLFNKNIDLTIPEGYILFIDGNLTLKDNAILRGNVVVNGNVLMDTNKTYGTVEATVYTSGNFTADDYTYLGTSARPTFIYSDAVIRFKKVVLGYGFLLGSEIRVDRRDTTINIIGGTYSAKLTNLDSTEVSPNTSLDIDDLYNFGVSPNLSVSSAGGSGYLYTYPK